MSCCVGLGSWITAVELALGKYSSISLYDINSINTIIYNNQFITILRNSIKITCKFPTLN